MVCANRGWILQCEVDPTVEHEDMGTYGMDNLFSELANAIPRIDEAMSFAEMLRGAVMVAIVATIGNILQGYGMVLKLLVTRQMDLILYSHKEVFLREACESIQTGFVSLESREGCYIFKRLHEKKNGVPLQIWDAI
ncbi:hypothetical protein Pyn_19537 [Prunus yedoensis var. nudiflora]|uniref:Uncharacterized protein n=1 Tax=Prunus yedoensis var. nudiflora TaxID=2094558 RepID=A0A314XRH4_PRUYE|nr:hypothetical protein Pyn_19537 [Prunus yedoensis var. nudiflora]